MARNRLTKQEKLELGKYELEKRNIYINPSGKWYQYQTGMRGYFTNINDIDVLKVIPNEIMGYDLPKNISSWKKESIQRDISYYQTIAPVDITTKEILDRFDAFVDKLVGNQLTSKNQTIGDILKELFNKKRKELDNEHKEYVNNLTKTVNDYKKDLFKIAMSYPNCYVASVSFGSNFMQTIKAMKEAHDHRGPSIIIAYCPCLEHGIKGGMGNSISEEKLAVDSGYTTLMRYNPEEDKVYVDSREPDFNKYEEAKYNIYIGSCGICHDDGVVL